MDLYPVLSSLFNIDTNVSKDLYLKQMESAFSFCDASDGIEISPHDKLFSTINNYGQQASLRIFITSNISRVKDGGIYEVISKHRLI
jgi:hypothetical protein